MPAMVEMLERRVLPTSVWVASTQNGTEGGQNGVITLQRDNTAGSLNVMYSVDSAGSTAQSGVDYTALSGNVTFAAGSSTALISVSIFDDTLVESPETVKINLMMMPPPMGAYTLGNPSTATLTINDNDQYSTVTVTAQTPTTTEGSATPAVFRISRTNPVGSLTVNYTLPTNPPPSSSAMNGADYQYLNGSVTFANGETYKDVLIATQQQDDTLVEGQETVTLLLTQQPAPPPGMSMPGYYLVGAQNSATVTINDNDQYSIVTVTAQTPTTAEGSTTPGKFRITRTSAATPLTVNYTIAPSSTAMATDYQLSSWNSVNFAAGVTVMDVTVTASDDTFIEPSETVILQLTQPTAPQPGMPAPDYYIVGSQGSATVTIEDNDAPVVSISALDPNAAETGPDTGIFRISRNTSSGSLTVNYTIDAASTATAGSDYNSLSSTVSFANGETYKDVVVTPVDDSIDDESETVVLKLTASSAASGTAGYYVLGTPLSATVTIADDDNGPPEFTGYSNVTFGGAVVHTQEPDVYTATNVPLNQNHQAPGLFKLVAQDPDPNDTLTYSLVSSNSPWWTVNVDGIVKTDIPSGDTLNYLEPGKLYELTVKVTDSSGATDTATVKITMENGPQLIARDDAYTIQNNAHSSSPGYDFSVLVNDDDATPGSSPNYLRILVNTPPAHGVLSVSSDRKSFHYTPDAGFSGTDTFTYRAEDVFRNRNNYITAAWATNWATVTITVTANDPPVFTAAAYQWKANYPGGVVGTVLATDNDPVTYSIAPGQSIPFAINSSTGVISGVPSAAGWVAGSVHTFQVIADDGAAQDTSDVTITIGTPPIIALDTYTFAIDSVNNQGNPVQFNTGDVIATIPFTQADAADVTSIASGFSGPGSPGDRIEAVISGSVVQLVALRSFAATQLLQESGKSVTLWDDDGSDNASIVFDVYNDQLAPVFNPDVYTFLIQSVTAQNLVIGRVFVSDMDTQVPLTLTLDSVLSLFLSVSSDGIVTLTNLSALQSALAVNAAGVTGTVTATDPGGNSDTATITVKLSDDPAEVASNVNSYISNWQASALTYVAGINAALNELVNEKSQWMYDLIQAGTLTLNWATVTTAGVTVVNTTNAPRSGGAVGAAQGLIFTFLTQQGIVATGTVDDYKAACRSVINALYANDRAVIDQAAQLMRDNWNNYKAGVDATTTDPVFRAVAYQVFLVQLQLNYPMFPAIVPPKNTIWSLFNSLISQ